MTALLWFRPWMAYAAVIAALLFALGTQTVRLADAHLDIAQIKQANAEQTAVRERVARTYTEKLRQQENAHAASQQAILEEGRVRADRVARDRAAADRKSERVRNDAATAAARDRAEATADPAACARVVGRNETLYGLVSDGFSLVEKGRVLLDACVGDLLELKQIIRNDRQLFNSPEN